MQLQQHSLRREAARRIRAWVLPVLCGALVTAPGCVELGLIPPPDNGGTIPDGNGGGNGNGNGSAVPQVRLTASNVTPQLNEELILRCELTNDVREEVEFSFQGSGTAANRLQVDEQSGVARVIIQETDLGVTATFTCRGTSTSGTGRTSNSVVIAPTAPPANEFPPP